MKLLTFVTGFLLSVLEGAGATSYRIEPLRDRTQPDTVFNLFEFGIWGNPVNNTPFLAGRAQYLPAIGTFVSNNFTISTLSPLPGDYAARLYRTFRDGSAIGLSFKLVADPDQPDRMLQQSTRVIWSGGIVSKLTITDPDYPGALDSALLSSNFQTNANGDFALAWRWNNESAVFRYNIFDKTFERISVENPLGGELLVSAINDAGQILARFYTGYHLFDPRQGKWAAIPLPYEYLPIGTQGRLSESGEVAFSVYNWLKQSPGARIYQYSNGIGRLVGPETEESFPLRDINSDGLVLGIQGFTSGTYRDDVFEPLYPRIVNSQGWEAYGNQWLQALGTNDAGQIFGMGWLDQVETAFVLTPVAEPVPEPGSLGTVLAALGVFAWRAAQRRGSRTRQNPVSA